MILTKAQFSLCRRRLAWWGASELAINQQPRTHTHFAAPSFSPVGAPLTPAEFLTDCAHVPGNFSAATEALPGPQALPAGPATDCDLTWWWWWGGRSAGRGEPAGANQDESQKQRF